MSNKINYSDNDNQQIKYISKFQSRLGLAPNKPDDLTAWCINKLTSIDGQLTEEAGCISLSTSDSELLSSKSTGSSHFAICDGRHLIGVPESISDRLIVIDRSLIVGKPDQSFVIMKKDLLQFVKGKDLRGLYVIVGRVVGSVQSDWYKDVDRSQHFNH